MKNYCLIIIMMCNAVNIYSVVVSLIYITFCCVSNVILKIEQVILKCLFCVGSNMGPQILNYPVSC